MGELNRDQIDMASERGTCRTHQYKTNEVVRPSKMGKTLMCWGGFGQPPCPHLKTCARENRVRVPNG